jgi:hypothetical protein
MAINATRKEFYLTFRNDPVPASFRHEPAASEPVPPAFPDTLDAGEEAALKEWRATTGSTAAALYAALSVTAQAKADEFVTWDLARQAWDAADQAARREQYAWFRADAAISNYDTVPPAGDSGGSGSGAPPTPQTKQEP